MNKTVLIVEDDSFLRDLAGSKLTKEGFTVLAAENDTAMDTILETQTPDIILLDLMLPGTDGFGLLTRLRENLKTNVTPIIVFSNLSDDESITKTKQLGATEYMIKSNFTLEEVVEKIRTILGIPAPVAQPTA